MMYYIDRQGGCWRGWFWDPDTQRSYSKYSHLAKELEVFATKNGMKFIYLK